ncbi:hypothetical protein CRYPA_696 [uncultured Candidatus Thioglobus sp.]|nr:hypothetical protein CRYPA_696 [uncultured Candidatus Thioglobus sp.]
MANGLNVAYGADDCAEALAAKSNIVIARVFKISFIMFVLVN